MTPARRLLYRLALASGYWIYNPYALMGRMPFRVLLEWQEYAEAEPFGEWRADLRAAMIAATIANSMGRAKGKRAFKLEDFMLRFGTEEARKREPTPRELSAKVWTMNLMMGGTFVDKRDA